MLHIIFLILKILGLVLLAAVGIIILLLAAFILLPARYTAAASWDGTMDSLRWRVKFHWLIHLISGEAVYENGRLIWRFRTAWKHFDSTSGYKTTSSAAPERIRTSTEKTAGSTEDLKDTARPVKQKPEAGKEQEPEAGEKQKPEAEKEQKAKTQKTVSDKKKEKKNSFSEKISAYWDKIKYTFKKLYDNIKALAKKKEKLRRFLTNEIHKNAFLKAVKELKRLLHRLCPEKLEGDIEFGFEDPAYTGYLLAGISLIYPMVGEFLNIRADFENKVLKGSVLAAGKLRLLYILIPAWNLFFDRNVKITYRHIKKFKL